MCLLFLGRHQRTTTRGGKIVLSPGIIYKLIWLKKKQNCTLIRVFSLLPIIDQFLRNTTKQKKIFAVGQGTSDL